MDTDEPNAAYAATTSESRKRTQRTQRHNSLPCVHYVLQKSILCHENQAVYERAVNDHAAAPTAHDKKAQGNALGNGHTQ